MPKKRVLLSDDDDSDHDAQAGIDKPRILELDNFAYQPTSPTATPKNNENHKRNNINHAQTKTPRIRDHTGCNPKPLEFEQLEHKPA